MTKITKTTKSITTLPKRFVRVVITEESPQAHRLIEQDGTLEYRMGVGRWKEVTPRKFRTIVRSIVQAARQHQIEYLAIDVSDKTLPMPDAYTDTWHTSAIAENLVLAAYEFTRYKTEKDTQKHLKEIRVCGSFTKATNAAFERGITVGTYANKARDIANTPGDDMTPSKLANAARDIARGTSAKVTVLSASEIKKQKMGLVWAVGKGADDAPKFIIVEYWGAGKPTKRDTSKKKRPIVFVGKGITYDTGGLNIKPSGAMHDMHLDMSGGAAVIASVACAAKLGIKKNIVGLIPAAENAVSDRSMRAGDIVTSLSGKTVEVVHTDAEGRLVLADALTYADRYRPRVVLDVATLTGAALVALGQHASALLTKDDTLARELTELGEQSGDLVWPLPLWDEYKQHIKSDRADVANIAPNFSRFGGTIEGGTFLAHFAGSWPWAHIDLAPRMESISSDKLAKGATGEPVRLLVTFAENH